MSPPNSHPVEAYEGAITGRAITLGAGKDRPQGWRVELTGEDVRAFADAISAHVGDEAWWSVSTFDGDYRNGENWRAATAIALDLDYHNAKGEHAAIPTGVASRAIDALGDLPNLIHNTPRGLRVVLLLETPITDHEAFATARLGAAQVVGGALGTLVREREGLRIDPTVTNDRARLLYTPRATVDGSVRRGEVRVTRLVPWPVASLTAHDSEDLESAALTLRKGAGEWDAVRAEILRRLSVRDVLGRMGTVVNGSVKLSCPLHPPDKNPSAWIWTPPGGAELLVCGHGPRGLRVGVETKGGKVIVDAIGLEAHRRGLSPGKATAILARELNVSQPKSNSASNTDPGMPQFNESASDYKPKSVQDLLLLAEAAGEVEVISPVLPALPDGVGHAAGRITVIGAFTGGGKTSLCVAEAIHQASKGHPILVVTAELSEIEYARRIEQACEGDVGTLRISVLEARGDIRDVIRRVTSWAEPLDGGKAPVVIVDYLQRLRVVGATSREREVAEVAEQLQTVSRRLGVAVVTAAQLNRNSQTDTRPALHHFRESGLIEQVADVALLIGQTAPDRMYAIVAKNRWGGGTGTEVEFSADFARCRFALLDRKEVLEPLAQKVVEYVTEHGGHARLSDVSADIKIPGTKRHPKTGEIVEAGLATKAYISSAGVITLT